MFIDYQKKKFKFIKPSIRKVAVERLAGILKSDVKLSNAQMKIARSAFEKQWPEL